MSTKFHLGAVDYIVIAISLLIASGIGIWFHFTGKRLKTTQEYLMAGKDMNKIPVILSTTVTMMSAASLISSPSEVYRFGISVIIIAPAMMVGNVLAAYIFTPVYFQCDVSTVYELLEMRYGKKIRYTVSALFVIQMVFYMTVALYGPVLALSAITDLSLELSILIFGFVCTFYCMLGGLKAVLWTDAFQAILMLTFVIILHAQGIVEAGGVGEVYRKSSEGLRLNTWNFSPDMTLRYTFWSTCARGLVGGLAYYGTSQVEVQRLLSLRNYERAKSSLVWSSIATFILKCMCFLSGLVMYGIFYSCDPIKDGIHTGVTKYDQLIPYYIVTRFNLMPGLTGLCVAGIFSGSLSTLSSALNSASTVTVIDFMKPLLPSSQITEKRIVCIAKLLSIVYGIICIGLTFAISKVDSLFAAGTILLSTMEGPSVAIFLIAVLTRKGNEKCALVGLFCGVVFSFWMGFGSLFSGYRHAALPLTNNGCPSQANSLNILQNSTFLCPNSTCLSTIVPKLQTSSDPFVLYKVSFVWLSTLGCCVSLFFTLLATLITGWKDAIPAGSKCLSPITHLWSKYDPSDKNSSEHVDGIRLEEKLA